jgi:UDP-N-acetylglucosamine--N-acetylmuramyl-(pentapeptide) pyrophosphoryl-undecaprenol N-acetylglucosamine transferase
MGRANRLLGRFVTAIATGFPNPGGLGAHAGMPSTPATRCARRWWRRRDALRPAAAGRHSPPARVRRQPGRARLADLVPPAIAELDPALPAGCRSCSNAARGSGAHPGRLRRIGVPPSSRRSSPTCRRGWRRPSRRRPVRRLDRGRARRHRPAGDLVPLPRPRPGPAANAGSWPAGGGWAFRAGELHARALAAELTPLLADPARLSTAAAAARTVGSPDAVERSPTSSRRSPADRSIARDTDLHEDARRISDRCISSASAASA